MTTPVVAVVGYSNSGKTTVASSLVRTLTDRGYRVAAIKHCPHGHDADVTNSDTNRLYRAGAVAAVASSPGKQTRFERVPEDASLEWLVSTMGRGIDVVVAEGFKSSSVPKVLVSSGASPSPDAENVVAIVADTQGTWSQPTYGTNEIDKLADQIVSQLLDTGPRAASVSLLVDGVPVGLKGFPGDALTGIIRGFVGALGGVPEDSSDIQVNMSNPGAGGQD